MKVDRNCLTPVREIMFEVALRLNRLAYVLVEVVEFFLVVLAAGVGDAGVYFRCVVIVFFIGLVLGARYSDQHHPAAQTTDH